MPNWCYTTYEIAGKTPMSPDYKGKSNFTFCTETAWEPCHKAFAAIIQAVESYVDVEYEAEEPGMALHDASSPYMTESGEYYIDNIDVGRTEWNSIFGNDNHHESCYISEGDLRDLLNDVPGSDIGQKIEEVGARLAKEDLYLRIQKIDFIPFAEAAA